jgi:hypothetical protein
VSIFKDLKIQGGVEASIHARALLLVLEIKISAPESCLKLCMFQNPKAGMKNTKGAEAGNQIT